MRLILLLVLTFSFFISPVFSQSGLISVQVSNSSFEEGDSIIISGIVSIIIEGSPVIIQIFHNDNLIEIAQREVAQDGSFSHTVRAEGPNWQQEGEYVVIATYGTGQISEANFKFYKEKQAVSNIFEVDAGSSGTFDVEYSIRGGMIKNIIVDPEIFGMIILIESNATGSITVDLPREFIDAKKSDGSDDVYIILIDGIEVPYQESQAGGNSRTITVEFEEEDSNIEIIGTFVIPEFGTFAYLVLPVSIMFIFIITARKNSMKKIALKN